MKSESIKMRCINIHLTVYPSHLTNIVFKCKLLIHTIRIFNAEHTTKNKSFWNKFH